MFVNNLDVRRGTSTYDLAHFSFCRKTTLTKHVRRQHGGRPRSTDGESSEEENDSYEHVSQSVRSMRHASASTIPSQDLAAHYSKRVQHHHIPHHQHHLGVNNAHPRPHHPQAVYLSPNPSSADHKYRLCTMRLPTDTLILLIQWSIERSTKIMTIMQQPMG